jgi:hypothetical protein
MTTLWLAMSFGFFSRSAASVRWNSDKLRIMEPAEMMAMFAVLHTVVVTKGEREGERAQRQGKDGVGVVAVCLTRRRALISDVMPS